MKSTIGGKPNTAWASALPFYYGWLVLAASAVSELLITGATSYSASLFVLPLENEFGLSRANASSSVLILFLGAGAVAPFAGRFLDRFPVRLVMSLGVFATCLGFATIALTSSLWLMVLALLVPAAAGFMMLGPLTTSTLASRWFFRRRGLALGIAAIATSGGGFVVTPLLAKAIQLYGWRTALLYESAALAVIVLVLSFAFLKDRPADAGLEEHPENAGRAQSPAEQPVDDQGLLMRWREILGNRDFWAPSLLLAAISGLSQAILVSIVPYGAQLGFTITASALLISAFSLSAGVTKIVAGIIADHSDKRLMLFTAALCMILSLALLCFSPLYASLMAAFCLAGIALGCVLPTAGALIASRFGAHRFGATMGLGYMLIGLFLVLAVRLAGTMFDRTGSYHPAFMVFLGFCVLVALLAYGMDSRLGRKA